jgi:hypothetical protein
MTEITKYHVVKGQIVKVPEEHIDVFAAGDVYLVDTGSVIYLWCGKASTPDERFVGAITSVMGDRTRTGRTRLVTVDQGDEPKEFLSLFGGGIEVTSQDTEGILRRIALKKRDYKLFRVHIEGDISLFYEVKRTRSSLTSDDVYLLDTFNKIFIWQGKGSTSEEKETGFLIAQKYDSERAGPQEIIPVSEGEETKEFLRALK